MIGDIAIFFIFMISIFLELFANSIIIPLPVSDTGTVRYRTLPYMTYALIFLNAIVFILFLVAGMATTEPEPQYNTFLRIWLYGYRETYMVNGGASIGAFTMFTSMFMHAGFYHLLGNMFFLWTFGRRIEDACGPWRYLLFYLLAGAIASFAYAALNPSTFDAPLVGASGAISGLLGAYLLLFPGARVNVLWAGGSLIRVPLALMGFMGKNVPIWKWTLQVPAWLLLVAWIGLQIIPSLETITQGQEGGVAALAHLAGVVAAILVFFFVRKDLLTRYLSGRRL